MKILIAIPTYKRPQFLPDCIKSVLDTRVAPDIALTAALVDNDADQTARPIYQQTAAAPFPFVYLPQPQQGLSRARNKAIEFALTEQMDAILLVDDDMRLPPDYLQALIDVMRARKADAARGHMRIIDKDGNAKQTRHASLSPWRDILAGNGVLISRRIYGALPHELGLRFDPRYHPGAFEDGDFFYHAHVKGARLCQIGATFDELRLPNRLQQVDRKVYLKGAFRRRQRHVHIRKFRGGMPRAVWYALRRAAPIALQILFLIPRIPFSPAKSAAKMREKSYQLAGLAAGLLTPHFFYRPPLK